MNDETEQKLTIINKLLASFPATQSGSSDDVIDGYLIGSAEVPAAYLLIAATRFLSGSVPGQHTAFPPSPAQLATEARSHWYKQLEADAEHRRRLRPPEKDDIPPEERDRVKAGFDALIADLSSKYRTDEAAAEKRRRESFGKTNARFMPDMSEDAVRKRLHIEIGDPEGASDAA